MHDEPCDEEVERRTASLALHRPEEVGQRLAPDEEREGLVLVGRPRGEARDEEARDGQRACRDPEREPALGETDSDRFELVVASVVNPAES